MGIEVGAIYETVYPFVREMYTEIYIDNEGIGSFEVESWKPGCYFETAGAYGESLDSLCDAEGKAIYTVVSLHKPGKYPERVFYIRSWVDPNGKAFGKNKLRMTTKGAFTQLTKGYRHQYEVIDRKDD